MMEIAPVADEVTERVVERYLRAAGSGEKRRYADEFLLFLRGERANEPDPEEIGVGWWIAEKVREYLTEIVTGRNDQWIK
jgi:hypothetical protein